MAAASGNLLVELLTEELPPKALASLSKAFAKSLVEELRKRKFLTNTSTPSAFATPRRLAVRINDVHERSPDEVESKKGPSVKDAYDAAGRPTKGLLGFLNKWGVGLDALSREQLARGEVIVARIPIKGRYLDEILDKLVETALKALPVTKTMRWGMGKCEFVRPVHRLVMMFNDRVVQGTVLGMRASNTTQGHRFLSELPAIPLSSANEYEGTLLNVGRVIANYDERRNEVEKQLIAMAAANGASLGSYEDLLDEVTALVEYPSVYVGTFDPSYLDVPQECLMLTMRQNQKYFPLLDAEGRLTNRFLIVSNIRPDDPRNIIEGNQKVVTPRLADAKFFFEQDKKLPLPERLESLKRVTFQQKLGSQYDRVMRIKDVAVTIGRYLHLDEQKLWSLGRAAEWSKCDLVTSMVTEFPELQGIMGKYYLLATDRSWDTPLIAQAIEEHYRPRFAGDDIPPSLLGACLALADKLDSLVGIFGVGLAPTGDKDPFALRRGAIGVLRILVEKHLPIPLSWLLEQALGPFRHLVSPATLSQVQNFIVERLKNYLREKSYSTDEIEAVLSPPPARLDLVIPRIEAVRAFRALPEAASLAIANKRIRNILLQAPRFASRVDSSLLKEPAELELYSALCRIRPNPIDVSDITDYTSELFALAALRPKVDRFFNDVMVNVEDDSVRVNRLALLSQLSLAMNTVADISKLAE